MKKSILHKKTNENKNIQNNLNFEEYKNLAANKFHNSKKVNFKTRGNEPLNISNNEIEKNYRRNSYQFAFSTNNKNNYTKFGFSSNANVISNKKNYLLDDEITQLHNKNIYEKILGINIIKKNKKIKDLNTEMINNKDGEDSDNNRILIKKRPRNYSFYESKSTKILEVYNYIDKDEANNDLNIDNNYNNTSFYCSNQVRNSLTIENKYSSKTLKAEPHLDGEIFNNHSIVFITDKSEPFKKSYSHNIPNDLKFGSDNQTSRDYKRWSLQNNTVENRINSQISELSENNSDYQMKNNYLEKNQKEEKNVIANKKDMILKDEMIKNNRIIKQKKINHKKEIMKTKNAKKTSSLQMQEKKKKNKNKNKDNLINQLLSKEFLISINRRNINIKKDKKILLNLNKDGFIDFHFQKKKKEKQIKELKNNLYNSNNYANGSQNYPDLKYNIHNNNNNIFKDNEINGINKKSNEKKVIGFEIGEKEIFYNKINKSNIIKMNNIKNDKFRKSNSDNRYKGNYNNSSNKRNKNKSNTLSISQKMIKYTSIKNKTIEEINNNSFKNLNKLKNNIINDNRKKIVDYKNKNYKKNLKDYNTNNSSNNNIGHYRKKKPAITINKYNNLDEKEEKDLNRNNYIYTGSDEELKIILNDNPEINNDSNKAVRNKQIINFIYKKKEIKEKQNKNRQKELKNYLNENDLNNTKKNNCENKNIKNMNCLNPSSLNRSEIRNKVGKDMPKNIDLDKYENGGLRQDKENKKHIYSLSDNANGEIKVDFQKNYKIGKIENDINKMNNDEKEDIILNDDKIVYFNSASPVFTESFGENRISKYNNINIDHQKEEEKKEKKLNQENKNINEQIFCEEIKNNKKNNDRALTFIGNNKENKKDKNDNNINGSNYNNNKKLMNNINIDYINNVQEILGNCENQIIKNNTINNCNFDSTSILELRSEYEFNINEDKFYRPLNKYENIFNFKKINPFESPKSK